MYSFDQFLQVDFQDPKYRITHAKNDEGDDVWNIAYNPHTDSDGKETSDFSFILRKLGDATIAPGICNIKADVACVAVSSVRDLRIAFFAMKLLVFFCAFTDGKNGYTLFCSYAGSEEKLYENAKLISQHVDTTLASLLFNEKPINAERITAEMVLAPPAGLDET